MFDRNNFFTFLWVTGGIILLTLLVTFVILPQMNSGSSKSSSSFGKLMKNKASTSIPTKLKWGSDFNHNYEKTKIEPRKKNEGNAFSHFKKK
ncbi:MAG: hypothetical protein HRT41_09285 [Campylobacteraceae bacterium]|nr:hypothetical protein [Campylobacteraceae bacterium]